MIGMDELRKAAETKKLSLENTEKDYLIDAALFSIFSEFGDTLVLKGGTSLYKMYNLNRFSEDLDFTLNKRRFDAGKFTSKILRSMRSIGIDGRGAPEPRGNEINIKFHFKGPLYSGGRSSLGYIMLNVSHRERIIKQAKKEMLIPIYREIPSFELYAMDEGEILAEKIRAVMTRTKARDVYDLWFLLKKGVEPDFTLTNKKLNIYDKKFSWDAFVERIDEKKASWDTDLRGLIMGNLPEFEKIKKEILTTIRKDSKDL